MRLTDRQWTALYALERGAMTYEADKGFTSKHRPGQFWNTHTLQYLAAKNLVACEPRVSAHITFQGKHVLGRAA
jgi:hypothetical protein